MTDDADPPITAIDVVVLDLTIPPHAPTADAGGPYFACAGDTVTLDGSGSFDVDEGQSQSGAEPFDTITAYDWELDGVTPFDYAEAQGVSTDVTFNTVGIHDIGLRVTDNSAAAYPGSPDGDLQDTDNTFVAAALCVNADLSISVASSTASLIVPDSATVTVTVSNGGADDASGVIVDGLLSNAVDITSMTPAQGSCAATGQSTATQNGWLCELGDIASGGSVDIVVVIFADEEGTADFEFTVGIDENQLLQLTDPDESNNTVVAVIQLIDEVIVVVVGKGAGFIGPIELLILGSLVAAVVVARRRRAGKATMASLGAALIAVLLFAGAPAEAQDDKGMFIGASIGSAGGDINASRFADGLADAGYSVSDVSVDDNSTGWKVFAGYMFNEYVGVQGSYVDLGELESEFTASVPPDEIDALLATGAELLPGRGEGFLADLLLQYPVSERVSLYLTLGIFFADPDVSQTVVSGGTGTATRSDDDNDFAGSIGVKYSASDSFDLKVGYESYEIDGDSIDVGAVALVYKFGENN